MSQSEQIAGLRHHLKGLEKLLDIQESAQRLCNNKDFKKLILEHYFESEAARNVHLLAMPGVNTDDVIKFMNGISEFRAWFHNQCTGLENTKRSIADTKDSLESMAYMEEDE